MRKQDKIIVWPAYFDATKTRKEGRKIPKSLAVPSPKITELKEAVEKLGFEHELVPEAGYPKTPWLKTGMLLIAKKEPKNQIIKKIASRLLKIRSAAASKPI
ncbi:signal recognition particle protein Srp19 [Candidatus Bathyarchaeota archaeon]|nr:signal recognition particle protein Srp19 [Candidatus Bathyarchaeota archaeon]